MCQDGRTALSMPVKRDGSVPLCRVPSGRDGTGGRLGLSHLCHSQWAVVPPALTARSTSADIDLPVVSDDARPAEPARTVAGSSRQSVAQLGIDQNAAERILDPLRVVRVHRESPFPAVGEDGAVGDDEGALEREQEPQGGARRFLRVCIGKGDHVEPSAK